MEPSVDLYNLGISNLYKTMSCLFVVLSILQKSSIVDIISIILFISKPVLLIILEASYISDIYNE